MFNGRVLIHYGPKISPQQLAHDALPKVGKEAYVTEEYLRSRGLSE